MIKHNSNPQSLLSTLWIFVLFNMIFRDLHEFLNEGYIEKLMSQEISEKAMLFYGFILEIPILMVVLSKILNNKANKWTNIVAASIAILGMLSTLHSADLDDTFFTIVNSLAVLAIIRTAWKLPTLAGSQT